MKSIHGHYFAANINRIEEGSYFINLAGLMINLPITQRLSIAVCDGGTYMNLPPISIPGRLKGFAVNRQGFGVAAAGKPIIREEAHRKRLAIPSQSPRVQPIRLWPMRFEVPGKRMFDVCAQHCFGNLGKDVREIIIRFDVVSASCDYKTLEGPRLHELPSQYQKIATPSFQARTASQHSQQC
nr:hypothetical protein [Oligoflexus sp.]